MKEHSYFSFINNTNLTKVLRKDIENNQIHHAYMIVAGDNDTANMFANFFAFMLLCENSNACLECNKCKKMLSKTNADFKIYPKNNKNILVEDIEDIVEQSLKTAIEGNRKVFILNNFENANQTSQNKLLKTLEEPPKNCTLLLSVSNSSQVLPTIKSRCKILNVDVFTKQQIYNFLIENGFNNSVAELASEFSNGNIGLALKNAESKIFNDILNLVLNLFLECNKSQDMLKFVNEILKYKQHLDTFFMLTEIVINKVLMCKNLEHDFENDTIKLISENFTNLSLKYINNQIAIAKEKLQFNCNATAVVDIFVLKFLEEKHKWK